MDAATPESIDQLVAKTSSYLSAEQVDKIVFAFEFAREAHQGQKRKAGGDYIWHPVAVAEILADIQLDPDSIVSALLHDVVEDTPFSKQDIIDRFGEHVADIVDGVTKLGKMEFKDAQEAKAESFRKMIMAMSRDIRVILVKLGDRLHNMRTLGAMRRDKQVRIAKETLEIFAPIAGRLGINAIRIELEDLCFKAMHPLRFAVLEKAIRDATGDRKEIVSQITETIQHRLEIEGIAAKVIGRQKHLFSLYKKMKNKGQSFEEVRDIFAFRIIVKDDPSECYRSLGAVHSLYKPLFNSFKDYIALVKSNGYQSLHTSLFGPNRIHIEVQIRTEQMHEVAEHGIAAHWQYKEDSVDLMSKGRGHTSQVDALAQEWVKNLLEIQQTAGNSQDFLENVKIDLFPDVIYVFTPKGDIVSLPRGATVVDFAYAVHTKVGHSTVGCFIDRKYLPLRSKLENGQTVEVIRSKHGRPDLEWLGFVTTAKARSQIRQFMRAQQSDEALELGKRLLKAGLRRFNMSLKGLDNEQREHLITVLNVPSWEQLLEELGNGSRMAPLVSKQIHDIILGADDEIELPAHSDKTELSISGTEGMVVHYANCCHPIPGDDIVGHISSGKGLVIHRCSCSNTKQFLKQQDKVLDVHWSKNVVGTYIAKLQLEVKNQRGSLATIANAIASTQTDIEKVNSEDKDESYSLMEFEINVTDRVHLANVMRALKRNPIVEKIHRL